MYTYTDRMIKTVNKKLIHIFAKLKSIAAYDELNVINEVNTVYAEIDITVRRMFLTLAELTYDKFVKNNVGSVDDVWLDMYLDSYDPVTKYVYSNEFDRKRARLIEAVIASDNKPAEIDAAMRSMSFMVRVYAVRVTDEAVLKAYRDDDVEIIEWDAEEDEKTCPVCAKRDGNLYEIEALPPKPHMNCRCMFRSVDDTKQIDRRKIIRRKRDKRNRTNYQAR